MSKILIGEAIYKPTATKGEITAARIVGKFDDKYYVIRNLDNSKLWSVVSEEEITNGWITVRPAFILRIVYEEKNRSSFVITQTTDASTSTTIHVKSYEALVDHSYRRGTEVCSMALYHWDTFESIISLLRSGFGGTHLKHKWISSHERPVCKTDWKMISRMNNIDSNWRLYNFNFWRAYWKNNTETSERPYQITVYDVVDKILAVIDDTCGIYTMDATKKFNIARNKKTGKPVLTEIAGLEGILLKNISSACIYKLNITFNIDKFTGEYVLVRRSPRSDVYVIPYVSYKMSLEDQVNNVETKEDYEDLSETLQLLSRNLRKK